MQAPINVRFRPSLIIFVDEAGEQICQQLKQLIQMTHLDEVLHQCIALLQVTSGTDQATPVPSGQDFPPFDADIPREPGDLEELLACSLNSIQLERRLMEIAGAGYLVPETRPQIYIVGDARSTELEALHKIVQGQLRSQRFATLVCYVLDAFEGGVSSTLDLDDPSIGAAPNAPHWLQNEVPNFCYFYENFLTYPVRGAVTRDESHYAAAESLFALIATGITPEPRFDDFMKLSPNLTSYTNIGCIGTTLIIFPREAALDFCSARLGTDLVVQWLDDINRELLPEKERRRLQKRAHRDAQVIEDWIKDSSPRPFANEGERDIRDTQNDSLDGELESIGPDLDILLHDHTSIAPRVLTQEKGLHRDLRDQTKALFRLFHFTEVEEEVRTYRKRSDTWMRLVYQRGGRAVEVFHVWNQVASNAWEAAGVHVQAQVKYEVDTLWSDRDNGIHGFEMAKTYVDTFDDDLNNLQDQLSRLRETHERDYRDSLDAFERLSDGEWVIEPDAPNIANGNLGAAQASPNMTGQLGTAVPSGHRATTATNATGANPSQRSATHQHLLPHEERIVNQLEQRVRWLQEQVPSVLTQIAIGLPFLLTVVLTALALYPQSNLLFTLALIVGAATVIGFMNWLFWRKYRKKVKEAQKDLLRFYRRHFAHRCEQREDTLRLLVIKPLLIKVMSMQERLDDISRFISTVQDLLQKESQRVNHEFFSNPSGMRDIYISNGERLQKQRRNTLEELSRRITQQRESRPVETWHRSLREIKEQLIESFRTDQQSILEITEEDTRTRIETFTREITRSYLRGPLVDIQRALESREIWNDARKRAGSPLYHAEVGIREPQLLFVCGQGPSLTRSKEYWPTGTIPVLISDQHDWVLVVALFYGGKPPTFDPDTLFPPKHTPEDDDLPISPDLGSPDNLEDRDGDLSGSPAGSPAEDEDETDPSLPAIPKKKG